jgi:hypothetical protein
MKAHGESLETTRNTRDERRRTGGNTVEGVLWLVTELAHPTLTLVLLVKRGGGKTCEEKTINKGKEERGMRKTYPCQYCQTPWRASRKDRRRFS